MTREVANRRINASEDYELAHWSKRFGVKKEQRKEAIKAVGDDASKVEQHLKDKPHQAKR